MTKTVIRGFWPGINTAKLIDAELVPKAVRTTGKSKYDDLFFPLTDGKALQCTPEGRRFYANALRDWLKLRGFASKMRPTYHIGEDGMAYVMLTDKPQA